MMQRDLAVGIQPAALDDVARAGIEAGEAFAQQLELVVLAVGTFVGLGGILGFALCRDHPERGVRVVLG